LRDVFYPVLKFRDKKQTFAKVEGPEMDFFLYDRGHDVRPKSFCGSWAALLWLRFEIIY
jgi:hypothetical protein